jgi:cysteine desulfurase/selenocysteine lyase
LISQLDRIRADEFPIAKEWAYLDHATFGPLPRCNVEASTRLTERMSESGLTDLLSLATEGVDQIREKAGHLLNCAGRNIAFLKSTSECLGLLAAGLDWQEGDEVIAYELDFPADVYPWIDLERRGVRLRFIRDRGRYRYDIGDVEELIGERTRAVCLSLVNFAHGFRAPVEHVSALCRPAGIWVAVDAVQAMGVQSVDVNLLGADIVAAHGYKFLLSGFGVAVCYCSDRAISQLSVPQVGWKNIKRPIDTPNLLKFNLDFADSARRFESSIQPLPAIMGLGATLDLLLHVGLELIERHVSGLTDAVVVGARRLGYDIVSSLEPCERSAVVSLGRPHLDAYELEARLSLMHVACAAREGRVRV